MCKMTFSRRDISSFSHGNPAAAHKREVLIL